MSSLIIFTDLDGTLLDRKTYDWSAANLAIESLKEQSIPIVFCSSKTRAEQVYYQKQLDLRQPYIVENGSAIFIPAGYFALESMPNHRATNGETVIELGIESAVIQTKLDRIKEQLGLAFRRYSELAVDELASLTGLDIELAALAKLREYSETIETNFNPYEWEVFHQALSTEELACLSGGHLHTVTANTSSKGEAVRILIELFRQREGKIISVGLGDSPNDCSMLEKTDIAYQVQRPDGTWHDMQLPKIRQVGIGPAGWSEAIAEVLAEQLA